MFNVISSIIKPLSNAKNSGNKLSSDNKVTSISNKLPAHGKWHYGENWPNHGWKKCGGQQQSPIRLISQNSESREMHINFRNYKKPIKLAYIQNNGHTVQIGFADKFKIAVYGSGTNFQSYLFKQMHFHWGSYNGVGAEHLIDGYRGPLELHLVHYNKKYGDFDTAMDKVDGLVVLGVIFKISSRNNRFMSTVIELVKEVPKYNDRAFILRSFTLRSLLPSRIKPFFVYNGSLTTPPCHQSVLWYLITFSFEKQFRKCRSENNNPKTGRKKTISNNFRPIQALNERQVYISA
ncbi:carbonic anhydrase 6-like [Oppia nitens]|uniref:carbonic anhydrase 6-like n=1 Tax=Oppia nitens TaxID=1686743 RepID=UPI0023DB089C|nr:carbonic anhydrase 6-like [Oppia nitens]